MAPEPQATVRAFYEAASAKDAAAVAILLATAFHEDAAVEWPAGLPYGGRFQGTRTLGKIFEGLAAESAPLGPEGLELISVVDGGDGEIAAQVSFDFCVGDTSIPSGALELWKFEGALVKEIRAYYWDTAACAALLPATHRTV